MTPLAARRPVRRLSARTDRAAPLHCARRGLAVAGAASDADRPAGRRAGRDIGRLRFCSGEFLEEPSIAQLRILGDQRRRYHRRGGNARAGQRSTADSRGCSANQSCNRRSISSARSPRGCFRGHARRTTRVGPSDRPARATARRYARSPRSTRCRTGAPVEVLNTRP